MTTFLSSNKLSGLFVDLAAIAFLRILVFSAVLYIFGEDPNQDSVIFQSIAENPKAHLIGEGEYSQFSAFIGYVFAVPKLIFPSQHWLRIFFLLCELTIYGLIWSSFKTHTRWILFRITYISGIFTMPLTAIWAQDEIFAIIPLLILVLSKPKRWLDFLISIVGFYFAKPFYIFVAFSNFFNQHEKNRRRTALPWGLVLVLLTLTSPSEGFTPNNEFGTTLWIYAPLDYSLQKFFSLAIAVGIYILFELIFYFRGLNIGATQRFLLFFSLFLTFFYHINFEYFVFLTIPLAIYVFRDQVRLITMSIALVWFFLSTGVNVMYASNLRVHSSILEILHFLCVSACFPVGLIFISLYLKDLLNPKKGS